MPELFVRGVFDKSVNEDLVQATSIPAAVLFAPLVENSEHAQVLHSKDRPSMVFMRHWMFIALP
jgi:hypothetical protein